MLSKRDLLPAERVEEAVAEWRQRLGDGRWACWRSRRPPARAWTSCGRRSSPSCPSARPARRRAPGRGGAEFEAEHRVYRPVGEGGYWVEREEDGGFRVLGRGVELLFERHDLGNEEALAYLEQRLKEIGVVAALRAAGFEPGDDVRVGEHEFELHPEASGSPRAGSRKFRVVP